jgi:signal transduction histidine kinase
MIKDNGIEIKKEFQEELFKKFYQNDQTRKTGPPGFEPGT